MKLRLVLILLSLALIRPAFAGETGVRAMSLQDCIQAALEHNLDLKISRYNPQLSLYNLRATYEPYDPIFNLEGRHDYNKSGSRRFEGLEVPGSESDTDSFGAGLGGLLPTGLRYDLNGSVSDATGTDFSIATNGLVTPNPFEDSRGRVSLDLTQPLLKNFWIDSTRLNIRVGKNLLKQSELGLRFQIMTVVNDVEQRYFDLAYSREAVKVQEKAVELAGRLVEENRRRVEVGALAPLDEKQAESQAAISRADLLQARNVLSVAENALKRLMNDNIAEWVGVILEPTDPLEAERHLFDLQDSWTKGLTQRPDILQAKLEVERYGIQLKYTYNQLYPQLDAIGGFGYGGSSPEFSGVFNDVRERAQPFHYYGGRIVFPLANTGARNRHKGTKVQSEQVILQLKKLEQDIMFEIDNAIKVAQTNFERVGATRAASDFADAALQAEQKKLENGKSTSFIVLQLQRDLTTARSEEIRALTVYQKSLAQLAFLEGETLERRGVTLVVK